MRVTKIKCFGRTFSRWLRSHRAEVLPLELEEIFEPRQLDLDEPEDDETETARALWNGRSGSCSDNLAIWGIHNLQTWHALCDTRDLQNGFSLTEMRCPTCEARPLPLPPRPGMLPRCFRFNQCIGVDLVNLEVREDFGKAIDVVCWGTGLQIVQSLWNGHTAHAVMSEFKAV